MIERIMVETTTKETEETIQEGVIEGVGETTTVMIHEIGIGIDDEMPVVKMSLNLSQNRRRRTVLEKETQEMGLPVQVSRFTISVYISRINQSFEVLLPLLDLTSIPTHLTRLVKRAKRWTQRMRMTLQ